MLVVSEMRVVLVALASLRLGFLNLAFVRCFLGGEFWQKLLPCPLSENDCGTDADVRRASGVHGSQDVLYDFPIAECFMMAT